MSGSKPHLFLCHGVALLSEYNSSSPWIPLQEREALMIEEAEIVGLGSST